MIANEYRNFFFFLEVVKNVLELIVRLYNPVNILEALSCIL